MSSLTKTLAFAAIGVMLVMSYFVPYLLIALILVLLFIDGLQSKNRDNSRSSPFRNKTFNNRKPVSNDPLKAKGDAYERHIGKRFEDKGDLVVYNGFIRGFEDGGVDLVAISPDGKTLNLIQCKSWHSMTMELFHIQKVYQKLTNHNFDFLNLPIEQIKTHLHTHKDEKTIREIITHARQNQNNFTIRKTLYIASEKVVNLEIGKHLIMIQPDIFRYEDMKIVVERI
jgi:hypothetical protein